jgi:hypothetical protein
MAKAKKDDKTQTDERATLGSDDKHPDVDHSHAGYLSQEDADIRLQRATGDSRTSTPQE